MKIAVIFDADPYGGGGFYQSLRTLEILKLNNSDKYDLKIITTSKKSKKNLKEKGFDTELFKKLKWSKIYNKLSSSKILDLFLSKINIKNPFKDFLDKNNFDLVYFLGPSNLINLCDENNYIVNIYDLNHKIHNYFPEYRKKKIIDEREEIFQNSVNKSFKIIVDTLRTKNELRLLYNCVKNKISVIPFNPFLPRYYENLKINGNKKIVDIEKFNFGDDKKLFFYPAQFWSHKNHGYILNAVRKLKEQNKNFLIIFCGANKGNFKYIMKKIDEYKLQNYFKIFNFLTDDEVVYLYQNVSAIIMPTYVARSSLPLYEAFYFEKNIFYSKDILDKKLEYLTIPVDLENPDDLAYKMSEYIKNSDKHEYKSMILKAKDYYLENCNEKIISQKIFNIFSEYKKLSEKWTH